MWENLKRPLLWSEWVSFLTLVLTMLKNGLWFVTMILLELRLVMSSSLTLASDTGSKWKKWPRTSARSSRQPSILSWRPVLDPNRENALFQNLRTGSGRHLISRWTPPCCSMFHQLPLLMTLSLASQRSTTSRCTSWRKQRQTQMSKRHSKMSILEIQILGRGISFLNSSMCQILTIEEKSPKAPSSTWIHSSLFSPRSRQFLTLSKTPTKISLSSSLGLTSLQSSWILTLTTKPTS